MKALYALLHDLRLLGGSSLCFPGLTFSALPRGHKRAGVDFVENSAFDSSELIWKFKRVSKHKSCFEIDRLQLTRRILIHTEEYLWTFYLFGCTKSSKRWKTWRLLSLSRAWAQLVFHSYEFATLIFVSVRVVVLLFSSLRTRMNICMESWLLSIKTEPRDKMKQIQLLYHTKMKVHSKEVKVSQELFLRTISQRPKRGFRQRILVLLSLGREYLLCAGQVQTPPKCSLKNIESQQIVCDAIP